MHPSLEQWKPGPGAFLARSTVRRRWHVFRYSVPQTTGEYRLEEIGQAGAPSLVHPKERETPKVIMKPFNAWINAALCIAIAASTGMAHAQTPAGLMKQDAASKGSTDVAHEGFEKTADRAAEGTPPPTDASEFKISAGGFWATGNTRNLAFTSTSNLRLRRGDNEFSAAAAANYARGAAPGQDPKTTAENFQGRVRYDRFLSKQWALFIAQSARRDRFQGLALRQNFDPGVAYYFLEEPKHRAWGEAGYDLQYDIRRADAVQAAFAKDGTVLDRTVTRHSARLFLGYDNQLNEAVRFTTGLEYLQAVVDSENWRLNWDVGLTSQLSSNFSLASTFSLRYDHNPLPGVKNTDTTMALSLVYTLL